MLGATLWKVRFSNSTASPALGVSSTIDGGSISPSGMPSGSWSRWLPRANMVMPQRGPGKSVRQ